MPNENKGIELWERAKDLERRVASRKRECYAEILIRFPTLLQKNFGGLALARRSGKLPVDAASFIEQFENEVSAIANEAKACREKSEMFLADARNADTRVALNPLVDSIPAGVYPKLRDCKIFPLRFDCNHGENTVSRWTRCEHMEYDEGKSIYDPHRWICTEIK